ncbi:hypothetical protein SAMN05216244_1389 [Sediminibacillus halophilus]|uniref:Uncharacterized protein n=1 Tax=Sediminibacillus halophilus TaxID=482461 RepID=A0A1G9PFJ5_9BACI|nr:hypothetical protein SAMN05216244_1389 [Sediminibacillus halophilus]
MLFKLLSTPFKIMTIILITAVIMIFCLSLWSWHYQNPFAITNWIIVALFLVNGIHVFNKKRSWGIWLIAGAIIIAAISWVQTLYL